MKKLVSLRGAVGDAAISSRLLHPFGVRNDTRFTIITQPDCEDRPRRSNPFNRKKLKGQVILENAIVFVSLAVIAVSAMYLFAKLNKNIINRIEVFRNSRKPALNSNNYIEPVDFIHREKMGSICPDLGLGAGGYDFLYSDDLLMTEAELLNLKSGLIFAKVLPYNINLMRALAVDIKTKPGKKRDAIKKLIGDAKGLINESIGFKNQARAKFQEILDKPAVPGMYDLDVQNHPELYGLDPAIQEKEIINRQEQNEENRQNLNDLIEGFESSEQDFIKTANDFIFPKLDFISISIERMVFVLEGKCSECLPYLIALIQEDYDSSVALLDETFTSVKDEGGIWTRINDPYLSPVLRNDLVNLSARLKGSIAKDDLTGARDFISQMQNSYIFLGGGQPSGGSDSEVIDNYPAESQQAYDLIVNNPNLSEEELEGIQDILNNGAKNTFQNASNDNIIKELRDILDDKLEEAEWAWENWEAIPNDDKNIQKKEIYKRSRDYAIDICKLYAEIIYKLTQPSAVYDQYK
ncbi:MAG: hypothetical protein ABIH18_08160 [Candidatus Omnitrophota bacterium]